MAQHGFLAESLVHLSGPGIQTPQALVFLSKKTEFSSLLALEPSHLAKGRLSMLAPH